MFKPTVKNVEKIIDEYIEYFGKDTPKPNHIIVDKKYHIDDIEAPAAMIGPIDGEYGLYINVKDYIFDSEDILIPIVLHELAHYRLLLDGKQSKENQHDEEFQNLASKIENMTNIKGIKYGENFVHEFIKYRNKTFFPIFVENENGKLVTRIQRNKIPYWKKYLKEGVILGQFKSYKILNPTNRQIFEQVPLTDSERELNCVPYDEDIFHLNL